MSSAPCRDKGWAWALACVTSLCLWQHNPASPKYFQKVTKKNIVLFKQHWFLVCCRGLVVVVQWWFSGGSSVVVVVVVVVAMTVVVV